MDSLPSLPLGERIRAARLERKMTQDDLAKDTFSKSYVSAVELGKIRPSINALRILSRRLQLPISSFLENVDLDAEAQRIHLGLLDVRLLLNAERVEEAKTRLEALKLEQLSEADEALALFLNGWICALMNKAEDALAKLEESRQRWTALGETTWVVRTYDLLGQVYFNQRRVLLAIENYRTALETVRREGTADLGLHLSVLTNLATAYNTIDSHDDARALFAEAQNLAKNMGQITKAIDAYRAQATLLDQSGQMPESLEALTRALTLQEYHMNAAQATRLLLVYGSVYTNSRDYATAEQCFNAALDVAQLRDVSPGSTARAYDSLANLYLRQAKIDEAETAAIAAQRSLDSTPGEALGQVSLTLGRISEARKDTVAADAHYNDAITILTQFKRSDMLSEAYFAYGEALLGRGEASQGAQYLKLAYEERSRSSVSHTGT